MRLRPFLFAGLIAASLGGCTVRAHPVWVVDAAPPAARVTVVTPRPGYVWIEGRWEWIGGGWHWQPGWWVRERPGFVWIGGGWYHDGGHWRWRDGRWDRHPVVERPRVRDHR